MRDQIIADLMRDEGLRLKPYLCTENRRTIGVGRNLDDVGISETEAKLMLNNDINRTMADLNRNLPWWLSLPSNVQRALVNMAFNMGIKRLLLFKDMLAALKEGDFEQAASEALDSNWSKQVGDRAQRIARMIRGE